MTDGSDELGEGFDDGGCGGFDDGAGGGFDADGGDGRPDGFDHLFAPRVRETLDESTYGAWRSISAPDAVSLSFGFPFPGSFPDDELVAAAEAVFAAEGDRALQYGGGEYADRLVDVVREREGARGVDCTNDELVMTSGASHGLGLVCRTFLAPGDDVFLAAPTFMGALHVFRNHGAAVTGFPVDDEGIDVAAMADGLATRRAAGQELPKLVYVVPNFQNPTGVTLSRARRERLLELAAEYDLVVVEDDAYGELRYDGEEVAPLAALDDEGRVVRLGTFSKTVAPGVRTGWAVAHEEIAAQFSRLNAGGPNTFTRGALARYCEAGNLGDALPDLRAAYERRRDHLLDCLVEWMPDGTGWTEPAGGFFVWVTLPAGLDSEALLSDAAEEGVTYLPGNMFHAGEGGERSLRLSFSHVPPEEMTEGIRALGRATRAALDEA